MPDGALRGLRIIAVTCASMPRKVFASAGEAVEISALATTLREIRRQIRTPGGYRHHPGPSRWHLARAIDKAHERKQEAVIDEDDQETRLRRHAAASRLLVDLLATMRASEGDDDDDVRALNQPIYAELEAIVNEGQDITPLIGGGLKLAMALLTMLTDDHHRDWDELIAELRRDLDDENRGG